jgi:hypothetical protein
VAVVGVALALMAAPAANAQTGGSSGSGDSGSDLSRVLLLAGDDGLRAQGMDYTVQQIDFFGRDGGHSTVRWMQKEFRWVRADARRGTQGIGLTLLVDHTWAESGAGGVDPAVLDDAVTRAARTWRLDSCRASNPLRGAIHPGGDASSIRDVNAPDATRRGLRETAVAQSPRRAALSVEVAAQGRLASPRERCNGGVPAAGSSHF